MAKKFKTIWFDVDDVLVDTSFLMEQTMKALTGKVIPSQSWPHHGLCEIYGLPESGWKGIRERWLSDGVIERAPLREGVVKAMEDLAQSGFKLGLITARAWHPRGEEVTWDMASKHGLAVSDVVVLSFEESKAVKLKELGVDVSGFIDDTYRHVRECLDSGWQAYLLSQPWNKTFEAPRVDGLCEFSARVHDARGHDARFEIKSLPVGKRVF